jgi:hypothetical protein
MANNFKPYTQIGVFDGAAHDIKGTKYIKGAGVLVGSFTSTKEAGEYFGVRSSVVKRIAESYKRAISHKNPFEKPRWYTKPKEHSNVCPVSGKVSFKFISDEAAELAPKFNA